MNIYASAAKTYRPKEIKTIFIAESPPEEDENGVKRYFYFPDDSRWEFLLDGIAGVVFPDMEYDIKKPEDKKRILEKLKEGGYFLVDACEFPINKLPEKEKTSHIQNNYKDLKERLKSLVKDDTQIVLIKKNIYDLLAEKLKADGFNVINEEFIDFPSNGNQGKFKKKMQKLKF